MAKLQERTKNPLNVRYVEKNKWLGQTGKYKGFCVFKDEFWGIRAALVIIMNYMRRGKITIRQIISTYAPPSENATEAYVNEVAKYCYLRPDEAPKFDLDIHDMLVAMYKIESGVPVSDVPDEVIWNVIGWMTPQLAELGIRFTKFFDKDEMKEFMEKRKAGEL